MSATAFWRRLDIPGRDAARVCQTATGYELFGQSVFLDPHGPAALRYTLDLAPDWSTREGRITGFIGERAIDAHIVRTRKGWTFDGKDFGMAEVVDLDLGFTPATNMVQLRRVGLSVGDAADFDVVWLEAGEEELVRYRKSTGECQSLTTSTTRRRPIIEQPSSWPRAALHRTTLGSGNSNAD